ncbi:MAG: enoyl-CoA hydratase/isomerase family protein [Acidobacteriota bacterium]|nr:enoyl-CoA hydratase/isomerase family protein [Acidobacteriota bacterium]
MADRPPVQVDRRGRVAVVTLDRPPVNALDSGAFAALAEAFESFGSDRSISAAVLTAAGDRIFCGGVDLEDSPRRMRPDGRQEDGGPQGDPRDQLDSGAIVRRCFWSIHDCAVPVVAALNGSAVGAGVALLASCDLLVASSAARVALKEINVGVLGGYRHAQRLVGGWKARRMLLTGDWVAADELLRLGAAEEVVEPDQLLPAALGLAERIAANSPIAVRLAKESANRVEALDLHDGYRLEQDYTLRVSRFADSAEARMAFLEKRSPDFVWE